MKKLVAALTLSSTLGACNFYATEICSPARRTDVPHLEGHFVAKSSKTWRDPKKPTNKDFRIQNSPLTIRRVGPGLYEGTSSSAELNAFTESNKFTFTTCGTGVGTIMEGYSPKMKIYSSLLLEKSDSLMSLTFAAFDKAELDAAKIPYSIRSEKPPVNLFRQIFPQTFANEGDTDEIMVVENGQLADPASAGDYLRELMVSVRYR